jgi:hypothetical protein
VLPRHLRCPPGQVAEQYFTATRGRMAGPGQPGANGGDGQPGDHGAGGELDCGSGADGLGRPWQSD